MFTLVLVTRNRPDFLRRSLAFYQLSKLHAPIIISDGSDSSDLSKTREVVEQFKSTLDVSYIQAEPNNPPFVRLAQLLSNIKTPYVAWVADDDFMVPASIEFGVQLLNNDPLSVAVVGRALLFEVENDGVWGKIVNTGVYPQKACLESDLGERLVSHMSTYCSTAYTLRRVEMMRESLALINKMQWASRDCNCFSELLDSMVMVAGGKIVHSGQLMLIRQAHENMTSVNEQINISAFDLLMEEEWYSDLKQLNDALVDYLMSKKLASSIDAQSIAGRAIGLMLAKKLQKNLLPDSYKNRSQGRVIGVLMRLPVFSYLSASGYRKTLLGWREAVRHCIRSREDRDILSNVYRALASNDS